MSEKQRIRVVATLVFLGIFAIYLRTTAPTMSFWDCGEFIACAYTLAVPHPPGSPLFLVLGKVFSLLPTDAIVRGIGLFPDYTDTAFRVNLMSPLAGALSAVFAYLVILHLINGWKGRMARKDETWSAHAGAVVGAFIFALAESNWFNAVEAEVYAYAIFLMMLALYLGLRWADTIGKPQHLSLTLFLAYLVGLSSGLHLLSLLVVPSIALLGLFSYIKHDKQDDSTESVLLTFIMLAAGLFVMGTPTIRWIMGLLMAGAGAYIILRSWSDGKDAWLILAAVALLGIGGYFGMHVLNASRLLSDPNAESAAVYGISENAGTYRGISVLLALTLGSAGVVLTFLTRKTTWRDIWAALLVAGSAAATIKIATGVFFWISAGEPFPTEWFAILAVCAGGAVYLYRGGAVKPKLDGLKSYHLIVALALLVIVGYSTYLMLMIRSGLNPGIDENNPETWSNLFYFLSRKQYGNEDMSMVIFGRRAPFQYQFWDMFVKYILQQFPCSLTGTLFDWKINFRSAILPESIGMRIPDIPIVLALLGLLWHFDSDRKRFLAMFALFIVSGIGLAVYLNMPDPQPRERHYVFTGATSVLAIWMGMGVTGIIRSVSDMLPDSLPDVLRKKAAPVGMAVLGAVVPVVFLVGNPLVDEYSVDQSVRYTNWQKHDRRHDTIGYDYAYNILQSCDPDAILFTNGDNDTFPLWYMQEVLGIRRDVRIVNLSLLNTDWYIKQLRDNEPRLPIASTYTDEYITDMLCGATLSAVIRSGRADVDERGSAFDSNRQLIGWRTKEVRAAGDDTARIELNDGRILNGRYRRHRDGRITVIPEEHESVTIDTSSIRSASYGYSGITWTLPRLPDYDILRVQDVMVYNLVHWNRWQRPVYFAVTVSASNRIGLESYLRMEGMVFRVAREPDLGLDVERSIHNLENVYIIRNMLDQSIYMDENMQKLVSNYRSAYLQTADTQIKSGNAPGARATFTRLRERLPFDWASAYSGATISRQQPSRRALRDITRDYSLVAREVIIRELGHTGLNTNILERIRATAQLLRFSDAQREGGELLALIEPLTRPGEAQIPIRSQDRVGILYEAALCFREADEYERALGFLQICSRTLAAVPPTPQMNAVFRNEFHLTVEEFGIAVQTKTNELQRLAAQATTEPELPPPPQPRNAQ